MVTIKVRDKRHYKGYRIKFFDTDAITEEVVNFVKNNKNAYMIDCCNELYTSREKFLEAYK